MSTETRKFLQIMVVAATAVWSMPAHAETLNDLAGRTHYHGIAFGRGGSAALLLATHHGLFAVNGNGEASRVSAVQDFMGFSPGPADPLTYYASGHPAGGGNSGFLKSSDGGANWTRISDGANGPVDFHQMDVSPADPKTVYGSYGDLQVSHDGGESWSVVGAAPAELIAIAASAIAPEQVYAATKRGLLISRDGGTSWQPLAFEGEIVSLAETGADGNLYAFVLGRGLMTANETTADRFNVLSNSFARSIPLHLAADSADSLHLALTTQANEVLESRDGGSTWTPFGAGQ